MKTKIIIILSAFFSPIIASAQSQSDGLPGFFIVKLSPNKEVITRNLVINPSDVTLEIMKQSEVERRFGKSFAETAVCAIITPKPGVKLVTLNEFYKRRSILGTASKLPLSIDSRPVRDTTNLLISENSIGLFKLRADSIEIKTSNHLEFLRKRSLKN